jgi:hypothetical protein
MVASGPKHPEPLPWSHRAAAMPWFSGGNEGQLAALRAVLEAARSGATDDDTIKLGNGETEGVTLRVAGTRLQPTGLLKRTDHGRWETSQEASAWLESHDDTELIAALHSRVRFVGELLSLLGESPKTHAQLNQAAAARYGLEWSTLDQVRRRTAWLRSAGVVELKFDNTLSLTSAGESLLLGLQITKKLNQTPEPIEQVVAPDAASWVSLALSGAADALAGRKPVVGYIPGTADSAIETLRRLVTAASPRIARSDFDRFCEAEFGIKPSSSAAALTTMRGAGLVEQVAADAFSPTPQALEWLSAEDDLDFMRWLHTRFLFFLEIVPSLEFASRPRELAAVAKTSYGFPREDVEEMRRRLQLLRCAGLVSETAIGRYRATGIGLAVASSVPLQSAGARVEKPIEGPSAQQSTRRSDVETLLRKRQTTPERSCGWMT